MGSRRLMRGWVVSLPFPSLPLTPETMTHAVFVEGCAWDTTDY